MNLARTAENIGLSNLGHASFLDRVGSKLEGLCAPANVDDPTVIGERRTGLQTLEAGSTRNGGSEQIQSTASHGARPRPWSA